MKLKKLLHMILLASLYSVSAGIVCLAYSQTYIEDESFTTMRWVVLLLLSPILFRFLFQLLTLCYYPKIERSRKRRHQFTGQPIVSVLIPAYNEEVGIIKTIDSVLNCEYENVEVIIINDGSIDKTDELICHKISEFNHLIESQKALRKSDIEQNKIQKSLKYISIPNGGKAKALNHALKVCEGDYIVTIDADCVMDDKVIENMLRRFADPKVGAVGGNVVVGNKTKPVELLQQLEYLYGFFFKRADSAFNSVYIIGGAAAAYRKSVLDEIGGFDSDVVTEDIEMSMRVLANGYKTRYASDAVTYTEGPSRWRCLFNQRLRWRFGRFQTFIKYQALFFSKQKKHNKYFTMLVLPVALYAEFALLFQGAFLAFFYSYTFITHDYVPIAVLMLFMALMVFIQVLSDSKSRFHLNLLFLAPIAWFLFYIVDVVEFQALFRSIKRLIKQEDLKWQKWSRVGIKNKS
jgi:cellulose synthase/poly-beta-1,6-N-acetylglucosamine synthase-like glycosyltransferase